MKYTYLTRISSAFQYVDDIVKAKDFADSLSSTQYKTKVWIVQELLKIKLPPNPSILILGGWYGSYLVPLLEEKLQPESIILSDYDEHVIKVAKDLHQKQKNVTCMVLDVDRDRSLFSVDVVINTSFEHMKNPGIHFAPFEHTVFAIQSCDNRNDPGHINTVASTQELKDRVGLSNILFAGRMPLDNKSRYMIIGKI
ncbi:hypothetical protein EBT25_07255 [bacterium]|nr:hypothetical protein [bacterium]